MTSSRRRQGTGIALMIAGTLAAGWMLYRAIRFVAADNMASTIGDETGWPALLLLFAVFVNCLALAANAYRMLRPHRTWIYPDRFVAAQTGIVLSFLLITLGGIVGLLGGVGLVASAMTVLARGIGPGMFRRSEA